MLFTNVTFRNNEVNKNASTFGRPIHHYWRSIPGKIDQWILLWRVHWLWVQIIVTNEPLRDYLIEVETTQISITWWMDIHTIEYCSPIKVASTDRNDNMEKFWRYYAKWKKSDVKGHMLYTFHLYKMPRLGKYT